MSIHTEDKSCSHLGPSAWSQRPCCKGVVPACAAESVFDVAALRVQTEVAMKAMAIHTACELAINAMKDTNKVGRCK